MELPAETSTFVHLRRCVYCGEPFGALRMHVNRKHSGVEVREFAYSTRSLPLTDHVHDDSNQSLSYLRSSDLHLEARRSTDPGRVRSGDSSVSATRGDLQQVDPLEAEWQTTAFSFSSLNESLEEYFKDLDDQRNFTR